MNEGLDMVFSSKLYKQELKRAKLQQLICYDESSYCSKKKKNKKIGKKDTIGKEKWKKVDDAERMQVKLGQSGIMGDMYSRDQMMAMQSMYEEMYGGEDPYGDDKSYRDFLEEAARASEPEIEETDDSFIGKAKSMFTTAKDWPLV
eukprot:TRINITY_DN4870_c0_g1_i1.p2 TRINITY_DN4870_c0_g1~~TRINITY_DN4870_c0_g1_i1.p2  ORF type:complete len:146 (+),score=57.28 TRINITY_DN4870_c0_g1_i1:49-486(+)